MVCVLVREGLQTTLERRARCLFQQGQQCHSPLPHPQEWGEKSLGSAGWEFVPVLGWTCWNGLLGDRNIIPTCGGITQHCSVQPLTAKPQNAAFGGWFADFLSWAGFSGVSHPGATCPCCARAAGWSLSGWHLRARYRAGVKSTMGKCLVDF